MSSTSSEACSDNVDTPATSVAISRTPTTDQSCGEGAGKTIEKDDAVSIPGPTSTTGDGVDIQAAAGAEAAMEPDLEDAQTLDSTKALGDVVEDDIGSDSGNESDIREDISNEVRFQTLAKSLATRKSKSKRRNLQATSYLVLLEDRLQEMESKITSIEEKVEKKPLETSSPKPEDLQEGPAPAPISKLLITPKEMNWREFSAPTREEESEPMHVIDVLTEAPYPLEWDQKGSAVDTPQRHQNSPKTETTKVERIRINSAALNDLIATLVEPGDAPKTYHMHLKPFKVLLAFEKELREELDDLLAADSDQTTGSEDQALPQTETETPEVAVEPDPEPVAEHTAQGSEDSQAPEQTPADAEDIASIQEAKEHLQCLLDFMDKYLASELRTHRLLRERQQTSGEPKVLFNDLWHLFAPGDILFRPRDCQASKVLAVRGGRPLLTKASAEEPSDSSKDKPRSLDQGFVQIGADEIMNSLTLTCFHMDFDGKNVGPEQFEVHILPFDNLKPITNLEVFPIEYANARTALYFPVPSEAQEHSQEQDETPESRPKVSEQITVQDLLLQRGKKFAELSNAREVAHREYSGFSVGKIREQIQSQIIVDMDLYYQKYCDEVPTLGLTEPSLGDIREIQQIQTKPCYCGRENCRFATEDIPNYDDSHVDQALFRKFLSNNQDLVRYANAPQHVLNEKYQILFPRRIYGFVLRSRTWNALNIDRISSIKPHTQSFDKLVLPEGYKTIVEGLVRTHSRGSKPVIGADGDDERDRRDDLVRGKGKGLIILLHGVPGVGKTSTAECVAEYTGRPLFALTCGDIGDNAQDVSKNLGESFQLAHRWGCVMLLDEADVFLQSRDKTDMQRNAVVSVFLRILEYYSGILFLTTNKVGTFDEAFKSRIHICLRYKELDKEQSMQIWKNNLDLISTTRPNVKFDPEVLLKWVKAAWKANKKEKLRPWNGRQIHNACQTAAALAEFQDNGNLAKVHLEAVAKATKEFDDYLTTTHGGDDYDRAKRAQDRNDDGYDKLFESKTSTPAKPKKSSKTDKSSSKDSEKKSSSKKKKASQKSDTESDTAEEGKSDSSSESE